MKARLKNLKDLARTTDNYYLLNELELLETEIRIEINKAQIEVYRKVNK